MNDYTDRMIVALSGAKESFVAALASDGACRSGWLYESPFDAMFFARFPDADKDGVRALSLICALYLSHLHCCFPLSRFRSVVTLLRENVSLYSFNCNHYDSLYARLSDDDCVNLLLLKDIGEPRSVELHKNDIFDAFDFLTNGL